MFGTSSNLQRRDTARGHGRIVLAALSVCLLLVGCSDLSDAPPTPQTWSLPGPDNTSS